MLLRLYFSLFFTGLLEFLLASKMVTRLEFYLSLHSVSIILRKIPGVKEFVLGELAVVNSLVFIS